MKLNEVFDSKPVPVKWRTKSKRKWVGSFEIGDIPYRLFFSSDTSDGSEWELSFSIDIYGGKRIPSSLKNKVAGHTKFGVLGTGNQGKVFSTVMKAMKELTTKMKPKVISFSAEEISRMKLYKRMVAKFAPSLGYKAVTTGDYFELHRKD